MEYSSSRSLCRSRLISHQRHKHVRNPGPAHLAKRGQLLTVDTIKQKDRATEQLALMNWPERPSRGEMVGIHHQFQIPRFQFLHAAIENDATTVDEHEVGEDVLYLLHLMGRHQDGAAAIEVVVQQGIV